MTTNLLILTLDAVSDDELNAAIETRKHGEDISIHVVAPATKMGRLQWLTGAEDEARAEAEELAERTVDAVDAEVETEVGERDPLLAVEDALAFFPADEILVAGTADEKTEVGLHRFGLPISRLDGGVGEEETGAEAITRGVATGRRAETPFVVVGMVGAVILVVIGLVSVLAFLVFWLA